MTPRYALALLALLAGAQAGAQPQKVDITLVHPDTSPALSLLARQQGAPSTAARIPLQPLEVTAHMRTPAPRNAARGAPPMSAIPGGAAHPPMPQVHTQGTVLNFEGLSGNGAAASDASGAVGATQYVQWVNTRMAFYNKADGALLLGPIEGNTVFANFTGYPGADACRLSNVGSPIVQYDKLAERWVLSQLAWAPGYAATGPYYQCIAVSATSDASGSYYRYAMEMRDYSGNIIFNDYPKLSVWPDGYYFTFVMFNTTAGGYRGPRICGLDRATMLTGANTRASCWDLGTAHGPLVSSDLDGTTAPPKGSPNYLLSLDFTDDGSGDHLFMWKVSFTDNSLSEPVEVPVAPFTIGCPGVAGGACVRQPAPGETLRAMGDRLMNRLAYRNFGNREVLLVNHTIQQPGAMRDGPVGVRWYELRNPGGAVAVYQQGSFAPDSNSRWMGSMAMDKMGNVLLGYSVSGDATPPGLRYTGRMRSEPSGRMENEEVITNGTGVQADTFHQWGHQSATTVDPVSDCTFWHTGQYIASTGQATWRTRIASAAFRNCPATESP